MPTRKTGSLVMPYKSMILAAPKSTTLQFKLNVFITLTTPKGVFKLFYSYFINYFISIFLFSYIFFYCCFIQTYRTYIIFFFKKCRLPNLYFISISLYSHNCLIIFPISFLYFPYIIFHLYFGIHIM